MFKYSAENSEQISLHDCCPASAQYINHRLIFNFPDGIFFEEYGEDWPNTGNAEVEFEIKSGVFLYSFESEGELTIRKRWSVEQLIEKINRQEWLLEFAYRYDGFEEILFTCWISPNNSLACHEGQLFIGTTHEIYRWNPPE